MMNKKQHKGNWANLDKNETKKLESMRSKLIGILTETNSDNRDTQILHKILEQLNWVIEQQYEES